MGEDFWSYGVPPNRKTLELFFTSTIARAVAAPGDGGGDVPPRHA